jgi:DME family drug/metabolite transporter
MPNRVSVSAFASRSTSLLNSPATALLLVMLAATLWATVGVASRLFPNDISVTDEAYGFIRTAVAGPALLLIWSLCGGAARAWPRRRSLPNFLLFGVCCAIFQIGLFRSFTLLGVTVTVFITVCLPPVIVVLWGLWRQPATVSRPVLAALALAVAGLAAFSSSGFHGGDFHSILEGLALSVIASVAFVLMSGAARTLAAEHPPLLIAGLGLSLASLMLAGLVFAFTPTAWTSLGHAFGHWRTGGFLLYLGLVPTALAYLLYCAGMARCRTAAGGLVASMIEPAVAAGLALLFLREWLSFQALVGCLMLFGAMLVLWQEEQRLKAAPAAHPATA